MFRELMIGSLMIASTALIVIAGNARADEGMQIGRGIVCDSASQAEQFFKIEADKDVDAAMAATNLGKTVCVIAPVAYVRHEKVSQASHGDVTVDITRITVYGFNVKGSWMRIEPNDQFTVFPTPGQPA